MQQPGKDPLKRTLVTIKVRVPKYTADWIRNYAGDEGVTVQAVVAPVLNDFARGRIQGGYYVLPDAHGNAGRRV